MRMNPGSPTIHRALGRGLAIALAAVGSWTSAANAELVQVAYEIAADDFLDGLGNPPVLSTSNSVYGIYLFTFDTAVSDTGIMPDEVLDLDIINKNGAIIDFDEFDSGVDTAVQVSLDWVNVTIGGNVSGVAYMTGLSNDFRVRFRISRVDFEVLSVLENVTFVTTVDAFYTAQNTAVTYIPEPSSAAAVPPALLLLAALARRRSGRARRRGKRPAGDGE